MYEILGGNLDKAFEELNIRGVKNYEGNTSLDDKTQVWDLSEEDYKKLCDLTEDDWKSDWGWWRISEGSNTTGIGAFYLINGKRIFAWDNCSRYSDDEDIPDLNEEIEDSEIPIDRQYDSLMDYINCELNIGNPTNVCALVYELSEDNYITIAELFTKYQG